MKIAIVGSTGLLGTNLASSYKEFDLKLFSRKKDILINSEDLEEKLVNSFTFWKPDIIINAVGLVDLALCEKDYSLAEEVNINFASRIASIAKKINAYYIHISTDHFYSDIKETHSEDDEVYLVNNYAKSKFYAEVEVLNVYSNSLVVRTNIIGFRKNEKASFFEWLVNSLEKNENFPLYNNYITSSISIKLLSEILIECFNKKLYGVYNIASKNSMSKYQFGKNVAKKFNFNFNNVKEDSVYKMNTILKRNVNNSLNVSKVEEKLNMQMPTIDETIEQLYSEYKDKK